MAHSLLLSLAQKNSIYPYYFRLIAVRPRNAVCGSVSGAALAFSIILHKITSIDFLQSDVYRRYHWLMVLTRRRNRYAQWALR
jgi:hypothetical protein